ncbi:MAG: DUF4403 family protein [Polyangia bacterium]
MRTTRARSGPGLGRAVLLVAAAGGLLGAGGCRTGRPEYTVNVPPNVVDIRPPRSVLVVQTPLRLEALQQIIDRSLPGAGPGGGGQGSGQVGALPVSWRLSRQPAAIGPSPEGIELRIPIVGELQIGGGFLSCRSGGIGGTLTVRARPTLDGDGALKLTGTRVGVDPLGSVQCAGFNVPIAQIFPMMLAPIERAVAPAVENLKIPLGGAVQAGLRELGRPRAVPIAGQPSCLDLAPSGLVLAPVGGTDLQLRLGLEVAPRLSLGPCPGGASAPPAQITVRQQELGDDYRVQVAVAVPAQELQQKLAPQLVGKRLGSGPRALTVQGVEVGDASGRVLVKADVTGVYNGAVFLWGTPTASVQGERTLLSVPDLQLATESASRLEDTKVALYELIEGSLADKVKPYLQLDVTERLAQARQALSGSQHLSAGRIQPLAAAGLTGVTLHTTVSAVQPLSVESRPGVVAVYTLLVGRTQLELR